MANVVKQRLVDGLRERFGELRKLPRSQSLFIIGDDAARIYIRYSKVHEGGRTFFGLREIDLRQLEGHNSFICFILDDGSPPLFVPYAEFEEVFRDSQVAADGQYKVQLFSQGPARELYITRQGRFNVEAYVGFDSIEGGLDPGRLREAARLSHVQVQTLLGVIGHAKGYDVYIPPVDSQKLDWELTDSFPIRRSIPRGFEDAARVLAEIDVVWVSSGRDEVHGLFEVEHSTPIYSGLLRFNDILLTDPHLSRFMIVSNDTRRALFARQLARPTFRKSGLAELASFLDYPNVIAWHSRVAIGANHGRT